MQRDYLRAVDRTKGKFRTFLLAMLRHFLANHRRDARAQKRGGGAQFVWLDGESVDENNFCLTSMDATPEQSFDRQWAMTLLDQVVIRLQEEYRGQGKEALFNELKVFITRDSSGESYADLSVKLDTTQAALKMAVSRLRRRYGELLRAEIARTVSTPNEVEDELRALFATLK